MLKTFCTFVFRKIRVNTILRLRLSQNALLTKWILLFVLINSASKCVLGSEAFCGDYCSPTKLVTPVLGVVSILKHIIYQTIKFITSCSYSYLAKVYMLMLIIKYCVYCIIYECMMPRCGIDFHMWGVMKLIISVHLPLILSASISLTSLV